MWQNWLNTILGLWIVAVPFLGLTGSAFTWTLVVTGIAVAILGIWGAGQELPRGRSATFERQR